MSWIEIGDSGYDICEPCHFEMKSLLVQWFGFHRCPSRSPGTDLQCEKEESHSVCRGCGYANCKFDEHSVTRGLGDKTTWFSCGAVVLLAEKK